MEHIGPARLRALLGSILAVASDLELSTVLGRIVAAAADLADARYAALGVLDDTGTGLADFLTVGVDNDTKAKIGPLPRGHGILGALIVDPKPLRLANLADHPASYGFPPNHPPMTSFLGVPIRLRNRVFGNLYLTDKRSAAQFSETDEEVLVTLAAAAAVAIENARLHAELARLTVVEERERIARDLHDTVIQRLFAAGLGLQATAQLASEDVAERLASTIDQLDSVIREVRTAIFKLEEPRHSPDPERAIRSITGEASRMLGYDISVQIDDEQPESDLPVPVFHSLLSTLRESLSNVARHARARQTEVLVRIDSDEVLLEVTDDGIGMSDVSAGSGKGLANVAERARLLGGTSNVHSRPGGGGTVLEWRVPRKTL